MPKTKNTQNYSMKRRISKSLGCLLSSALFNVISLTTLHINVQFLEETGNADASPYSAQKHYSRWMKYSCFHALDPLCVFLCRHVLCFSTFIQYCTVPSGCLWCYVPLIHCYWSIQTNIYMIRMRILNNKKA